MKLVFNAPSSPPPASFPSPPPLAPSTVRALSSPRGQPLPEAHLYQLGPDIPSLRWWGAQEGCVAWETDESRSCREGGRIPFSCITVRSSRPCPWRNNCCADITGHTGWFWYKPAHKGNSTFHRTVTHSCQSVPGSWLFASPSHYLFRCWQAVGASVCFWRSSDAAPWAYP